MPNIKMGGETLVMLSVEKPMLVALQNETVRRTPLQKGFPATVGLSDNVAVIIANSDGYVSLTHLDAETDLSFIERELGFVTGQVTIDIAVKKGHGRLKDLILSKLEELGLSGTKHTEKKRVIESQDGTVIFNHLKGRPQSFSFQDFNEIAIPGLEPGPANRLSALNYRVDYGPYHSYQWQLRIFTRQLNQALSANRKILPVIMHDINGWRQTEIKLEDDVQQYIDNSQLVMTSNNFPEFFPVSKMRSVCYVLPRYRELKNSLEIGKAQKDLLKSLIAVGGDYFEVIRDDAAFNPGTKVLYLERAISEDCGAFNQSLDKLYNPALEGAAKAANVNFIRALKLINDLCFDNMVKYGEMGIRTALTHYFSALGEVQPVAFQIYVRTTINTGITALSVGCEEEIIAEKRARQTAEADIDRQTGWRLELDLPADQLAGEVRERPSF